MSGTSETDLPTICFISGLFVGCGLNYFIGGVLIHSVITSFLVIKGKSIFCSEKALNVKLHCY